MVERSSQRQPGRTESRGDGAIEKPEDDGQEDVARPRAKRRAERQPKEDQSRVSRQDSDETEEDESVWSRARSLVRQHPLATAIVALLLSIAAVAAILWWLNARNYESTDDAFIDARLVPISAQVAGEVVELPVTDNQLVPAGGELIQIDQRNYRAALDQANAQVEQDQAAIDNLAAQLSEQQARVAEAKRQVIQAKAALDFSQQEYVRYQDLAKTGAGTVQRAQQASSDLTQKQASYDAAIANEASEERQIKVLLAQQEEAQAQLEQAKAQQELAEVNLVRTKVVAPVDGRATKITVAKGAYAQPGQTLMMFVPEKMWVTANFKETQLRLMRVGQPVDIEIDAYPDHAFKGHVDSIQAGSGAAFSLLPPENATGNYVKVVQRVPVKIVFDERPDVYIGPGMSVVPTVKVR